MSASHILYEVVDGVSVITLNRSDVMNAFSDTMREQLFEKLQESKNDPAVRCVMITGAGKAFCAGGDVASMAELQKRNDASVIERRTAVRFNIHQVLLIHIQGTNWSSSIACSIDFVISSDIGLVF